jgi:hypothetical protein
VTAPAVLLPCEAADLLRVSEVTVRRAFLGPDWRGQTVLVNGVPVRLTDYMGTANRAKVIDLDDGLFRRICGPLSMGVCRVTVTR